MPHWVLGGLEQADRSSLMADSSKTDSRVAIKRLHSIPSIFHLFKKTIHEKFMVIRVKKIGQLE
jgi:hypothetical protein